MAASRSSDGCGDGDGDGNDDEEDTDSRHCEKLSGSAMRAANAATEADVDANTEGGASLMKIGAPSVMPHAVTRGGATAADASAARDGDGDAGDGEDGDGDGDGGSIGVSVPLYHRHTCPVTGWLGRSGAATG